MTLHSLPHDIRGVFFDFDGTLNVSTPDAVETILKYLRDVGVDGGLKAKRAAHRFAHEYWANRQRIKNDMDQLGPESFWSNYICAQINAVMTQIPGRQPVTEAMMRDISRRFAAEFVPRNETAPGTLELLAHLRSSGVVLGLVSNRTKPLVDVAAELHILAFFDFTLAAGEIGVWKPDSAIFDHALHMAGDLCASQVAYVGDNYFVDVVGAAQAKLHPVLIDPLQVFPEASACALVVDSLTDLLRYLPGPPPIP